MANFMLDLAAITPSLEILSSFQEATGGAKSTLGNRQANGSVETQLRCLRRNISSHALQEESDAPHSLFSFVIPANRASVWKELLNTPTRNGDEYSKLCQEDAMNFDPKIRDDSFRTFKGNTEFWSKVEENSIIRVLKALSVQFGYVQGMNVLLGPFLYIMSEEESYMCMKTLLQDHIPRYVLKNLDGAHCGSKLFSRCLQILDPKLYNHIISKIPDLSIFSLRYVLTLFANSKQLEEVLKLWDATFAIGPHFNILLLCAKLMLLRDAILKEKRGSKILTILEDSPIVSSTLIDGAFCLLRFVPESLLQELLVHASEDPSSASSSASSTARSHAASPATAQGNSVGTDRATSHSTDAAGVPAGVAGGVDVHAVSAFVAHKSPTTATAQYTLNAFASASYDSHDSRSSCSSVEQEHHLQHHNNHLNGSHSHPTTPQTHPVSQVAEAPLPHTTARASPTKRIVSLEKSGDSGSGSSKSGSGSRPGTARTSPSSSANSSSCNSIDAEEVETGAGVKVGAITGSSRSKTSLGANTTNKNKVEM